MSQAKVSREGRSRHPTQDETPVFRRRKDPDCSGGDAGEESIAGAERTGKVCKLFARSEETHSKTTTLLRATEIGEVVKRWTPKFGQVC